MKLSESNDENIHFNLGKELFRKRKFKEAIKEFDKAIKKDPNFGLGYYYKGSALTMEKQQEKSLLYFDQALKINPTEADWIIGKSLALMELGGYEESIKLCYQALKLQPNKYWLEAADIHSYFKKFQDALDCVEKSLNYDPNNERAKLVKHVIEDGLRFGDNYYIPITRSLLLWEVPFKETIIYTTRIRIKKLEYNYSTDTIITDKGLITAIPFSISGYVSWDKVSFKSNDSFKFSGFKCKLFWDHHYETNNEFKTRSKNFRETITQLRKV